MRSWTCRAVWLQLPSLDHPARLADPLISHMSACLNCQAEAARYQRLHRSLAGFAARVEVAPRGLIAAVDSRLSRGDPEPSSVSGPTTRAAAAAGAVAAAAAGTVVMVRWMRARSAA